MFEQILPLSSLGYSSIYGTTLDRFRSGFPGFYRGFTSTFSEYLERYLAFSFIETEERKFVSNPNDEENIPLISLTNWLASQTDFIFTAVEVAAGDPEVSASTSAHSDLQALISHLTGTSETEKISLLLAVSIFIGYSTGSSSNNGYALSSHAPWDGSAFALDGSTFANAREFIDELAYDLSNVLQETSTVDQINTINGKWGAVLASNDSSRNGAVLKGGSSNIYANYAAVDGGHKRADVTQGLNYVRDLIIHVINLIGDIDDGETMISATSNIIPGYVKTQLVQMYTILDWIQSEFGVGLPISQTQLNSLNVS